MESGCRSSYRKFITKCCGWDPSFHIFFFDIPGYGQYSHYGIQSFKFHEEGKHTKSKMPEVQCGEEVCSWIFKSCGGK